MEAAVETISNRGSWLGHLPYWVRNPMLLLALEFGILGTFYVLLPAPGVMEWLALLYLVEAAMFVVGTWYSSVTALEVSPESLRVRAHGRWRTLAMRDIVEVRAHRHWQSPLTKGREPSYYVTFQMTKGWARNIQHIRPETGDRLLYTLHRLQKPILVYNWR